MRTNKRARVGRRFLAVGLIGVLAWAMYGWLPPVDAKYFPLINNALGLTPSERAQLDSNGFVVTDRLAFADFQTAYAYIYWKDLPVLITTDSLLQVVHQNYDVLLERMEIAILAPRLATLLTETRRQAQAAAQANPDPQLAPLYADLDTYLAVPAALLDPSVAVSPAARAYADQVQAAGAISNVALFGPARPVDFTLFQPRGHYTHSPELGRYFGAVTWLGQVDFRLVSYSPQGVPALHPDALASAVMLRAALDRAGQRRNWHDLDALFTAFVGRSDNTTLPDLDRLLADARIGTPAAALRPADPARLLALLTTHDYGQQRITGQILTADPETASPVPRPLSFMLLGSRFVVDAALMSDLVFDRLQVGGRKVERALPSPLDVMYALGNDRAAAHLQDEFRRYGYQDNLNALRRATGHLDPAFWNGNFYNRWLSALRTLNVSTTGPAYPETMHTPAWADKMLQTQLASWAQLRHDNILYAKQSFSMEPLCEYPAGYVEPYPAFYAALGDYAAAGQALFAGLDLAGFTPEGQNIRQAALDYFADLQTVAGHLQTLADKELHLQLFTPEEQVFLKQTAVHKLEEVKTCVTVQRESWEGWYPHLFIGGDASPALIADVHTDAVDNPTSALYPPRVLHVGTGPVATMLFIANTDEGRAMYAGPAFTYYETVTAGAHGVPPARLTDQAWQARLAADPPPAAPEWTRSFRLLPDHPFTYLAFPRPPGQP